MTSETGVEASPADAEAEIIRIIGDVAELLSRTMAFAWWAPEDVYQHTWIEALKILDRNVFDPDKQTLSGFLYVHARNRISNIKRKIYFRAEPPCKCCNVFDPGPQPCEKFNRWAEQNKARRELCEVKPLLDEPFAPAVDPADAVAANELYDYIEQRLAPELLEDYRAFRDGGKLTRARRDEIRYALASILIDTPWGRPFPDAPPTKSRSKLQPDDVRAIRAARDREPLEVTARRYDVSKQTISEIQRGITWRGVA